MPTPCNVWVAGVSGGSQKVGREESSDVFMIEHQIHAPFDPTTGARTGVRVHSPLKIVKMIDRATPDLHKKLCIGKRLETVELKFYRIDPDDQGEKLYYTITLTGAAIIDIRPFMPMSFLPENESYRHMEEVSFTYEVIQWDAKPLGGNIEKDEWVKPAT